MKYFCVLLGFLFMIATVASLDQGSCCLFASKYSTDDLLNNHDALESFIGDMMEYEGHFNSGGVGYNEKTGITYDGHPLNYLTGDLESVPHPFSAASKESLHINMLAWSVEGNHHAQRFVSFSKAIKILTAKMDSYEKWNKKYPGFGGFLPWFKISDDGMDLLQGWTDTVPGLDNGQLAWAIYALIPALHKAGHSQLANRWQAQLDMMKKNCVPIFYNGNGEVRAVTKVANVTLPPSSNSYYLQGGGLLDDPYEGELMTFFMDLFGVWNNPSEREKMWIFKRRLLVSVDYNTKYGPITVQKGWWYSSHEQWKFMVLPYLTVPIAHRIFMNCERARTINAKNNKIPGLYASINDVTQPNQPIPDYVSAVGIQEIAFEQVLRKDIITPYGAFPTILANQSIGLVWYHNMLMGPRMQGPYGSTEAVNVNGTLISPLTTWDSKITTAVATLGGVGELTGAQLKKDGQLERFSFVVNREYSLKFPTLKGEDFNLALPANVIPNKLGHFTKCTC